MVQVLIVSNMLKEYANEEFRNTMEVLGQIISTIISAVSEGTVNIDYRIIAAGLTYICASFQSIKDFYQVIKGQRAVIFEYEGENGAKKMAGIMASLREPLESFASPSLRQSVRTDYALDNTGLPKSDVLAFRLSDDVKFIVRPSGTEPKLKAYLFARGKDQSAAETELDNLEVLVRGLCS